MDEPGEQDKVLAEAVCVLLGHVEDAGSVCPGIAETDVREVARVLHSARTKREGELRGQLAKLGRAFESHKHQLALLTRAHIRTRTRLRVKVRDCEVLRKTLIEKGLYTRDQVAEVLRRAADDAGGRPSP